MANKTISVDKLSSEIKNTLKIYGDDITKGTKEAVDKETEKFVNATKNDAPKGDRKKYFKYISSRTLSENTRTKTNLWYVKSPEYRLTHLLVKGHKIANGKGTYAGKTRSQDFITDNYNEMEKALVQDINEVIKNGR